MVSSLHRVLKPFLLRRIKSDVIKDLPLKVCVPDIYIHCYFHFHFYVMKKSRFDESVAITHRWSAL